MKHQGALLGFFLLAGCVEAAPEGPVVEEAALLGLGGEVDSFTGLCHITGTLIVDEGSFSYIPGPASFHLFASGGCTGILNGQLLLDEPVEVSGGAEGIGSCDIELLTGPGEVVFPGLGRTIDIGITLSDVAILTGSEGGQALGVVAPQNPLEFVLGCLPPGFTEIDFQVTAQTLLPLRG